MGGYGSGAKRRLVDAHRINAWIEGKTYDKIVRYADFLGMNRSGLIQKVLNDYIDDAVDDIANNSIKIFNEIYRDIILDCTDEEIDQILEA